MHIPHCHCISCMNTAYCIYCSLTSLTISCMHNSNYNYILSISSMSLYILYEYFKNTFLFLFLFFICSIDETNFQASCIFLPDRWRFSRRLRHKFDKRASEKKIERHTASDPYITLPFFNPFMIFNLHRKKKHHK